jgi:hypothetical protein
VRVRLFELRLLATTLTILWAVGGGIVLIGFRPGGPVDLLVGIAACLPTTLAAAAMVWPPLVRSDRGSAGVFVIGLCAGLLLVPCIAGIVGPVEARGTEPLLPSLEVVYPWVLALLLTGLFAGLGLSRRAISEVGIGRRRLATSLVIAAAATAVIGSLFSGLTLVDASVLRDEPAGYSRFGPTGADLVPPDCAGQLKAAASARFEVVLSAEVDGRPAGSATISGVRSGKDFSWSAQMVNASDLRFAYSVANGGAQAWLMEPGQAWVAVPPDGVARGAVDEAALGSALSTGNRATAENRGFESMEGARARHCRIAVDGGTFATAFPQVVWLTGSAALGTWRGELDYWVFGDGEVGMLDGRINGEAQEILPHGLLATVYVHVTSTDRDGVIAVPTAAP